MLINRELIFRIVKINVPNQPEWRGYFHEWSGTSEHCLAIIETENGFVREVSSEYIQFLVCGLP